ncbi:MAG TPA: glycosyltransferase [Chitinophagales bacterium]|nr:glycosyltransferase [Chitinophagales bacterium]
MSVELKIFIGCVVVQCLYYILVFARLNFVRPFSGMPEFLPPASIVICAKNEAENLKRYLKVVLIQQYKQYEVIVVNDQSTDNTIDVLVDYYMRNTNLKIVNITSEEKKPYEGKKYALQRGIDIATFDTIVVTDADCRPATTMWLAKMVGAYMNHTGVVLGHSPYEKQPGFLNKLIRYENFMTALQYFGFARSGMPYMGVGRNLSYSKKLFSSYNGFDKNKDLPTGDDDLFVNAVASGKNTEVCIDKDAFMYTKAATTFSGWLNQKRRHLRSGFKYKFYHVVLLFLFAFTGFLCYGLLFYLLAQGVMIKIVLGLFAGMLLIKLITTFRVYSKLGAGDLVTWFPLLDIAHTVYLLSIFFLLLLKPKKSWT